MRTNIVFDEKLVNETFYLGGFNSIQELVNKALKVFIERRKPLYLRGLKGMG